jgi:hypothetical protein
MLNSMDINTGVSIDGLMQAAKHIDAGLANRSSQSKVFKALEHKL